MSSETESTPSKDPSEINFNAFVGAETGFLKGICFGSDAPVLKELTDYDKAIKHVAIKTLAWTDPNNQKDLLVGLVNNTIKVYNTKLRAFTQETKLDVKDDSSLVGLTQHDNNYLVGFENGKVCHWNSTENKSILDIPSGGAHLSCVQRCAADPNIFATGGKENDLKIWNLGGSDVTVPIFKAKNLPHVLELRVPVWVQDATFLPQTTDLVAVSTRYGQLRLYDTKVDNKNRPVINMEFCDHPLMSLSPTRNDRQVIVGSSQGKVGLVDIRNYGKEKIVHLFHGFNGSVRSIVADENTPYFVSCGLDRYLYLHNLNERKPVKKLYLKSRLTTVAITKDFLAEFVNKNDGADEVVSSWHNIDNIVLPGPGVQALKSPGTLLHSPTKPKRSKVV